MPGIVASFRRFRFHLFEVDLNYIRIIDKDYDHVLLDAQTRRLTLQEIQGNLVAEEVRKVKRART